MYNSNLKDLEQQFLDLIPNVEKQEGDYEQEVHDLEELIHEELEMLESFDNPNPEEEKEIKGLKKLLKKIKDFKKENEFYDAEAELDNMFPNRHDPDFDQDSMSYDSVFGDD